MSATNSNSKFVYAGVGIAAAAAAYIAYKKLSAPSTATTHRLVRESWAQLTDLDAAGKLFYQTMFEDHAELRNTLFKGVAMETQAKKLMTMIDGAVKILDKGDELIPALQQLGVRHSAYGVVDAQYPVVGGVLIKTLKKGLGAKFDAETEAAWKAVYDVMASVMMEAQKTPEAQKKYKQWQERQAKAAEKTHRLVRESWAQLTDLDAAGKLFYQTMFEDHAELRNTLFKGVAMETQAKKLMTMIDGAVKILDKGDELIPALQQLGVRHSAYGVVDAQYPVVGGVLIKTLKKGLGAKFDAETEAAWKAVYDVMASVMMEAQKTPEAQKKYKQWQERQRK